MTLDERLERLTATVEGLHDTVLARDKLIERLLTIVEKQGEHIAALERQWQAYLHTRPHQ
jgi:hypothetical protein